MKVSTRGRYGVRFMLDVAVHEDRGPVALRDVARRQGLSEKYLWQVLAPLKAVGLVRSVRGAGGGYVLSRPARKISVRDIVVTLEGESLLVDATKSPEWERSEAYVTREMWKEFEDRLTEMMEAITLQDLVEKQKAREQISVPTYSI